MTNRVRDVVVLLPGIMGSVLSRDGRDVWAISPSAVLDAVLSLGDSIESLTLSDPDADDGVRATRTIPDVHLLPGFWKIDGYAGTADWLRRSLGVEPGRNYFELPYDWRRDNRLAARKLEQASARWLHDWRVASGDPGAKLVLVAHSMGGLVARYFLEVLGGWQTTRALITFGTPFRGSLNALDVVANGFRAPALVRRFVDLTRMVRSFPSVYQLLPTYACVSDPDGPLKYVGQVRHPNLDPARVAAALQFHDEIAQAVARNSRDDAYRRNRYVVHPIVGSYQPTLQGARLTPGGLELLGAHPTAGDLGGDGTVPRVSATPLEESGEHNEMFTSERHASLQNSGAVLTHVSAILTGLGIDLGAFRARGGPAARLRVDLDDVHGSRDRLQVRALPERDDVSLDIDVENVDTGEARSVALSPTSDGWHEATLEPLPAGIYRCTVGGGPHVESVTEIVTVLPDDRVSATRRDRDEEPPITRGGRRASSDEGTSIIRHPSIEADGEPVTLVVDLPREPRSATDALPVRVNDLDPAWTSFLVSVELMSPELDFGEDGMTGTVAVRRNGPSLPWRCRARVKAGLAPGTPVRVTATFVYGTRLCGSGRRVLSVDGPARSVSEPGSSTGAVTLEHAAPQPELTVQIHRLDADAPGKLYWVLHTDGSRAGLPRRLSGACDLGDAPMRWAEQILAACGALAQGDHLALIRGIGERIYEASPPCFRDAYRRLQALHGKALTIQFVSDDPHIPWELMWPTDVEGSRPLAVEHAVARWLLDYETTMPRRLPRGAIVTIAPRYTRLPDLPSAQAEARLLIERYRARPLTPATRAALLRLLTDPAPAPIALLHFAGHGTFSLQTPEASSVHLEDGELKPLEVRHGGVVLGKRDRSFVIFNACEVGGAGRALGAIAGWAEAFVRGSFGGLLAPLWPVFDDDAKTMIDELLEGVIAERRPIGEALREIRERHYRESPTFLAYIYVGDVMAVFR